MKPAQGAAIAVALALVALAGCGGHGGSTTPTDPSISNLSLTFGGGCIIRGQAGTGETLTFNFVDPEGDVRGGTVENTTVPDVGPNITLTGGVPSNGVSITGTTSGTITLTACLHFGSVTSITEHVTLIDAAGHRSNEITASANKPAGAPEILSPGLRKGLGG